MPVTKSPLTDNAKDFLEQRGIAPEAVTELGLVSVKTRAGEAIGFRHHVDGTENDHWAYRGIAEKKFWQSKGTKRRLWNNQVLDAGGDDAKPLIITEGHMDALSLITAGFKRVLSVPDGAPTSQAEAPKSKYDFLLGIDWKRFSNVILATDDDEPGHALREDLAVRIGQSRCKFVKWPAGCKDANDVLLQHGAAALVEAIDSAAYFELDGLYQLEDLPELPNESPWSIGIDGLDDLWRPSPGRMTVLTGIPGTGKTTLITDAVCRIIDRYGIVVAIASFEDEIRESLEPRIVQWRLGKESKYATDTELAEARTWIQNHFVFIQPDPDGESSPTVQWFNDRAQAAVVRYNARMIILDPWNELDHTSRPADVSQTEYVGVMLARLRRAAKNYRYHLVVAAHPTKLQKNSKGDYSPPTGYDIADSANFVNKPDNGVTIHRGNGHSEFISWKVRREGVIGKRGKCHLKFNTQTYQYSLDLSELD